MYYLTHTPKFKTKDIDLRSKAHNPALLKITKQRVSRTWPLSIAQYKQIWNWEFPNIGPWVGTYIVDGIQGRLSAKDNRKWLKNVQDLPNFQEALDATVLHIEDKKNLNQILHDLSNINGILYFMKTMGVGPSDVLFDGETKIEADHSYMKVLYLRPDGVIMKGSRIVFLETDMGTHIFATLIEKARLYKKLIDSGFLQKMGYADISIVIHSFSKRIRQIQKKECMKLIESHVQYLDMLDNQFNYISQSGPGAMSYPWSYKWLDRAIKKAKKQWEDSAPKDEDGKIKSIRDVVEFKNEVMRLWWIPNEYEQDDDVEEVSAPQDGYYEEKLRERELAAELWVNKKDYKDSSQESKISIS